MPLVRSSALLIVFAAVGCSSSETRPAETPPPAPNCPPGQQWNGQYCAAQVALPPPGPSGSAGGPGSSNTPPGTPAQRLPAEAATVIAPMLDGLASQHTVAGAKPVNVLIAGQFTAGQVIEQPLQLQPGKCYTVVGASGPGIVNLDVRLIAASPVPGFPTPVFAQDQTNGPTAVLGGAPNCFHWAAPVSVSVNVVLSVSDGQGLAAARIYEK